MLYKKCLKDVFAVCQKNTNQKNVINSETYENAVCGNYH